MEHDEVVKAVIETMRKAKEEDGMSFEEAFHYAIDKRKFLIMRQTAMDADDENATDDDDDHVFLAH